jgi:crotonobetainyl-CoA:carnitine CoA-transferase CaiB-like acyl-CoA transferase
MVAATMGGPSPASVLDGCTVLDFGHFIAGPFCAALLADHGADVIRIERPAGAPDRYVQPVGNGADSEGAVYLQANRNKRSLTLDMFSQQGQAIAHRLVADADVVIANLPAKTLTAMGLDYATLRAIKPDIVLCTCNAFGAVGAARDRPGFDGIGQAMSGAMQMTGDNGVPRKAYAHYVDFCTASMSAFGIMLALYHRRASGEGQHVETSLLGNALAIMNAGLIEQHLLHTCRKGSGNLAQLAGPADIFRATDGWILMQVVGSSMFRRWAGLVGQNAWVDDPRFATDDSRGAHGVLLSECMARWCSTRTAAQCLQALESAGLPCAPIHDFQQALDDPGIIEQQFFQLQSFAGIAATYPVSKSTISLSATPASMERSAPVLGADTEHILADHGYDAVAIARFKHDGVI